MIRRTPRSTRTDTLFPYTTLFRSWRGGAAGRSPSTVLRTVPLPRSRPGEDLRSAFELARQQGDVGVEFGVVDPQFLDPLHRVHHSRVIASAEAAADFGQRPGGEALGQVHGDLTRAGDFARAAGGQIGRAHVGTPVTNAHL